MMTNYWIKRALTTLDNEILLVRQTAKTKYWYDMMPPKISAIFPDVEKPSKPDEFAPKVGYVHHLRFTKLGIEAVLCAARKYHRHPYYILYDNKSYPEEPFWLILKRK